MRRPGIIILLSTHTDTWIFRAKVLRYPYHGQNPPPLTLREWTLSEVYDADVLYVQGARDAKVDKELLDLGKMHASNLSLYRWMELQVRS